MKVERRITHRLVNYWQSIKQNKVLPSVEDIDSEDIPDMWDDCFIIQISGIKESSLDGGYAFSYVGANVQSMLHVDENGGEEQLVMVSRDRMAAILSEMLMTKLPIVEEVDDFFMDDRSLRYRMCLLPLGDSQGRITGLMGGLRYKYEDS